jgi:NAD(P)-dependent dehydrogenase (short-subunit alcohol dehydrogenase family)
MLQRRWGRIVSISNGIPSHPEAMIGMNAYATSKAAELAGSGVTANVFRPGSVDTAMQAWIREQEPTRIGADLHRRFARSCAEGSLMSPEQSAQALIPHLFCDATGQIWVADAGPDRAFPLSSGSVRS